MEALSLLSFFIVAVALVLAGIRLVRGPTDFDRLLAAETMALGLVGLLMLRSGEIDDRFYLDAALGLALFSFIGTVICARYLEKKGHYE
jgi:multisubunit Na+/H+ antiporter MnhF subunit